MRTINKNLYPKEGHFFQDKDGVVIRADSWAGLVTRVKNYRKRNGFAAGDAEREVTEQACSRNPGYCSEENAAYRVELNKSNLKGRVLAWLAKMRGSKDKQLSFTEDAQRRAAICAGCQFNQALPGGCASCKAALKESRGQLIGARPQDGRLNACAILGEDLITSVWFEQITEDNAELPAHCWRKRSI